MDFVDEKKGALPAGPPAAGSVEYLAEFGDAGEYGRYRLEMERGAVSRQPCNGRLAGARPPPEDMRYQRIGRQHPADQRFGSDQMILPDNLFKGFRPQPVGQRPGRVTFE